MHCRSGAIGLSKRGWVGFSRNCAQVLEILKLRISFTAAKENLGGVRGMMGSKSCTEVILCTIKQYLARFAFALAGGGFAAVVFAAALCAGAFAIASIPSDESTGVPFAAALLAFDIRFGTVDAVLLATALLAAFVFFVAGAGGFASSRTHRAAGFADASAALGGGPATFGAAFSAAFAITANELCNMMFFHSCFSSFTVANSDGSSQNFFTIFTMQ